MQTWAKRTFQSALVTGGLLVLGTGIAAAGETDATAMATNDTDLLAGELPAANLPPQVMSLDGLPTQALPNADHSMDRLPTEGNLTGRLP